MNSAATLTSISMLMICKQTSPFWIAILACITLKEPLILAEIIAMCICFAAIVYMAVEQESGSNVEVVATQEEKADSGFLGPIFALGAGVCVALFAVASRSLKDFSTGMITFWYCAGGTILISIYTALEVLISPKPS